MIIEAGGEAARLCVCANRTQVRNVHHFTSETHRFCKAVNYRLEDGVSPSYWAGKNK